MGLDYAQVHLFYNLPPAVVLTLVYRPLFTHLDAYRIGFLITIAVLYTIPWDSYLIRTGVWSYPPDAVLGFHLFKIPVEEVFFFVIQTYNTSLLYLFASKPICHAAYLVSERGLFTLNQLKWTGQLLLASAIGAGFYMVSIGGKVTYMGLILSWAIPIVLLLWSLAYQLITRLPQKVVLGPILVPTFYLWVVDALALKRGTWVIEAGTKTGFFVPLLAGLEIEEAFFFLITNVLVVFGLIAFDNALAVLDVSPNKFKQVPKLPSPKVLAQALLLPSREYDSDRITGLKEGVIRLKKKSRSFYLASGTFQGRLKIDLILLYSFCRIADDLVDDAANSDEAKAYIEKLRCFLDVLFKSKGDMDLSEYVQSEFPPDVQSGLMQTPRGYINPEPLYGLLEGFEMDLKFSECANNSKDHRYPIKTEADLEKYASRVAGTVAELIVQLALYHNPTRMPQATQDRLLEAGREMGIALQYVNIARDIAVDAAINRVYLPLSWLEEEGLSAETIIARPEDAKIERLRSRLLKEAFRIHNNTRRAIGELPAEARGPIRVAVESYMEIGRVLQEPGYKVKAGRATVPKVRRIQVAWRALES